MKRALLVLALLAAAAMHPGALLAQCSASGASNVRTCSVSTNATITTPRLATVTGLTAGSTLSLTDPTSGATMPYDAVDAATGITGFAVEPAIPLVVKSNARWSLYFGHQSTRNDGLGTYLWTATDDAALASGGCPGQGVCAWQSKPTGHLWVGTALNTTGAGYTRLNIGPATANGGAPPPGFTNVFTFAENQAPTGTTNFTLALKTTWRYPLDTPGTYTLPLQLILFVY